MTYENIRDMVMRQMSNDTTDYTEYPDIAIYINEGYDELLWAYVKQHLSDEEGADYPLLSGDDDEPLTPIYTHRAIADYATYMLYRNGNTNRQNRGVPYYQEFRRVHSRLLQKQDEEVEFTNLLPTPVDVTEGDPFVT